MDEEMRGHIEMQTQENIGAGMTQEEARYAALRQFGMIESLKEKCRDERGGRWLENLIQDIRFGAKQLYKNPGFTFVAVFTLGLGVGVNTSMFTALQEVMIRPLPYPETDRLVQIFQTSPNTQRAPHSTADFLDFRAQNREFEFVAALDTEVFNLSDASQPAERVFGAVATPEVFPLLGMQPFLGRVFTEAEDAPGKNQVVILEHGFWQRRFAGDTNILGRTIRLDGESVTVIGVMPEGFRDIFLTGPISLWRPIAFTEEQRLNRGFHYLKVISRLKPGMSLAQAQAGADVLSARLARDYPVYHTARGLRLVPLTKASLPPESRRVVWLSMVLASFVLLIACANLANLQFARTAMRHRELAIRGALGAPHGRLLRQLLTESLLIAFLGGLLGLAFALWMNRILSRQFVFEGLQLLALSLNWRVLGFALAASAISGLAFGLVPAWLASRTDINDTLRQGFRSSTGGRSSASLQHALIVAQIAFALVLLSGAGFVIQGLQRFSASDPGWRVEGLTVGSLNLRGSKYGDSQLCLFADRLQKELGALPGVEKIGLAWTLPARDFILATSFKVAGRPPAPPGHELMRFVNGVTPGYFQAMEMRIIEGRDFTPADNATAPRVLIINDTMAHAFWPGESAIGKRVDDWEIVGVVNSVRFPATTDEAQTPYQSYSPFAQEPRSFLTMVIRGNVPADVLRRTVAELDPDQPVSDAGPARNVVGKYLNSLVVGGKLLGGFAGLGMLLASLGVYGVVAGFVARRTNEIGVRMALGAQPREVLWLVVGKGLRLALVGTAMGLMGAYLIGRLLGAAMPQMPPSDPFLVAGVALLLLAVTLFACWLPARRAARVDPVAALKAD